MFRKLKIKSRLGGGVEKLSHSNLVCLLFSRICARARARTQRIESMKQKAISKYVIKYECSGSQHFSKMPNKLNYFHIQIS